MSNVTEVPNQMKSDYDYEKLYYENQDNIIGMYIKTIKEMALSDEEKDLALCYGMKAFADSKI